MMLWGQLARLTGVFVAKYHLNKLGEARVVGEKLVNIVPTGFGVSLNALCDTARRVIVGEKKDDLMSLCHELRQ